MTQPMHPGGIPVDMTVSRNKFEKPCPDCGETLQLRTDSSGNRWLHVRHDHERHRDDLSVECFPPPEPPKAQQYHSIGVDSLARNGRLACCMACGAALVDHPHWREVHDAFHRSLT